MGMYVEQKLRDCEACNRRFAVQYEFAGSKVPSCGSDRVTVSVISCPSCRHTNPLFMLMYAHNVVVKAVPGPDPVDVHFRPGTVRRILSARRPSPPPRRATRRKALRQAFAAAAQFVHRMRHLADR